MIARSVGSRKGGEMVDSQRVEEPSERIAPHFQLPDDRGQTVRLESFQGEYSVVLYFARSFG